MTQATKRETLQGWGNCPAADCLSYRPEKLRLLTQLLHEHEGGVIARGLGRSYGDASLQPAGVIRTERLDHFIEFDTVQGILRAQAGVTLADVMALCVPRGWLPPVIPGTSQLTLGGAFACNIHGKNHFRDGDFAEHVSSIRLTVGGGQSVECSPTHYSDLFWATAGGMGMTGIIEDITFKLKPIASPSLQNLSYRVEDIEEMVAAFEQYRTTADYMVGWIDHRARGKNVGRGTFSAANHILPADGGAELDDFSPQKTRWSVPFNLPPITLNRGTMALHSALRMRKHSAERKTEIVSFDQFFHPLDRIGHWNRLYGKRGFFQYQCMIPESPDIAPNLRAFLAAIQEQKLFSTLTVIKYHRESQGILTFPMRGFSIALDFPNTPRVRSLLPQMDRWVAAHGGRIYLAKDALLSPELFNAMYPQAQHWQTLINEIDPAHKFTSLMSQRLQWKTSS